MLTKKSRLVLFFVLVFLVFIAAVLTLRRQRIIPDERVSAIVGAAIYTLIILVIYLLSHTDKENFWDVSQFATCKGGPYFWQGDSEEAKECRALAATPEGRCGIASYNCPTGFSGQPNLPFWYTPLSGDGWSNERCDGRPDCGCPYEDTGLCSMQKFVN